MPNQLPIFIIGHSSHPLGSFLWLLGKYEITALVDIRSYPGSKRHPHFSRKSLSVSLKDEAVEYHWLESLGGNRKRAKDVPPSPNRGLEDEGFRNYADYMGTGEFRDGVARLMEIAGAKTTTLMCAEGDCRHCHRQLLSDYLVANGVDVQHILPTGEVKPHKLTPGAKVVDGTVTYPGQPTLFDV